MGIFVKFNRKAPSLTFTDVLYRLVDRQIEGRVFICNKEKCQTLTSWMFIKHDTWLVCHLSWFQPYVKTMYRNLHVEVHFYQSENAHVCVQSLFATPTFPRNCIKDLRAVNCAWQKFKMVIFNALSRFFHENITNVQK